MMEISQNEAALNVGKILLNEGINIYVVHLPKNGPLIILQSTETKR